MTLVWVLMAVFSGLVLFAMVGAAFLVWTQPTAADPVAALAARTRRNRNRGASILPRGSI